MGLFSKAKSEGAVAVIDSVVQGLRNGRNTFAKNLTPDEQAAYDKYIADLDATRENLINNIGLAAMKAGHVAAAIFLSGYRPFIGWSCGICFTIQAGIIPILAAFGVIEPCEVDLTPLIAQLVPMLTTIGARTYEKKQGVQDRH